MAPILLIYMISSTAAVFLPNTSDQRSTDESRRTFLISSVGRRFGTLDKSMEKTVEREDDPMNLAGSETRVDGPNGRRGKLLDYPWLWHLAKMPAYESVAKRSPRRLERYRESDVFYIRLPAAPYAFVPGLGYVSQPSLARPLAVYRRTVNPFVQLPTDFVSNGKPIGVHEWRRKAGVVDDSRIAYLDKLSSNFVSNGKPTSVYRWKTTNVEPVKRPDDSLDTLDMGPYSFNGKLTGLYLLRPDGSSSIYRSFR